MPGFLLQMLVMMPSGTTFCLAGKCGMHFWGVNSHDGMWHLEIAAVAFKQLPFIVPSYTGAILSGYNILLDFILYLLSLIGIPPVLTLFKILPVVWFVFYTTMLISLGRSIHNSPRFVAFLLFFGYFGGHLGYFLQLYYEQSIFLGQQSFALQSSNMLLNTQFALSLPFMLYILYAIKEKLFKTKHVLFVALCLFFIMGLKFYGGAVASLLVFFYVLEQWFAKKNLKVFFTQGLLFLGVLVLAVLVFYNPFAAAQAGSVFSLSPFATVHATIEERDMIYLPNMVNARYFLYAQGWSPKLLFIELFSTAIYVVLHFGTRIIGFLYVVEAIIRRKLDRFNLYVTLSAIFATALTVLLVQRGDWWNTVQFSYYGIFLMNLLAAQAFYSWTSRKHVLGYAAVAVVILLTIPANLQTIKTFTDKNTLFISQAEFEAMVLLREQPDGIIFNSFGYDKEKGSNFLTYEYTGYVAAFAKKQLYLGHLGPLKIIGVDTTDRLAKVIAYDCSVFADVDYIYYVKRHDITYFEMCNAELIPFKQFFENDEVKLYKKVTQR